MFLVTLFPIKSRHRRHQYYRGDCVWYTSPLRRRIHLWTVILDGSLFYVLLNNDKRDLVD